jgi:hypothetical protein
MMQIFGLDFTSTPSRAKPITCAAAELSGETLQIGEIECFIDFPAFEGFLHSGSRWRAGFDFPFGQPRRLTKNLGLAEGWPEVVSFLTAGTRAEFVRMLDAYRAPRPKGDKQHRRNVDVLARSCSPMMLYGTPVAKMYFEGAPRLLVAELSVLPMHPTTNDRVAVEAYPKLVACRYANGAPYKTEKRTLQTQARRKTRTRILDGLKQHGKRDYGFYVTVSLHIRTAAIDDPTGDVLDAVLCAVQAAWSFRHQEPLDGIPDDCDRLEGWIVDPVLLAEQSSVQ